MSALDRRQFLASTGSCMAHFLLQAQGVAPRRLTTGTAHPSQIVHREPWGSLEQLSDGVWAMVSTPLEDRTTLCNGGIVAGSNGAVVVEGFATPEGAAWMAEQTQRLTGRLPTHVIVTHYHGDHSAGLEGYGRTDPQPQVHTTVSTGDAIRAGDEAQQRSSTIKDGLLREALMVDPSQPTTIDLGGRSVRLTPRSGHTASDIFVEVVDPAIVFCGDLVWNNMFPNYRDAIPSQLTRSVRDLVTRRARTYVPGHGALADWDDLNRYVRVINAVEVAARRAFERGIPAATAATEFRLAESLGEWFMFSPRYYEVALGAWERELTR